MVFRAYFALIVLIVAITIGFYQRYNGANLTKSISEWGKQNELKVAKIKREEFKIEFNEAEWNALAKKLESTRYFNKLENVADFSYGFNPEYAKELVEYWRTKFNWRRQVNIMNKFAQYRATVNNTIIHYIYHETNRDKSEPINLLLIDGWPGSAFSFLKMIVKIETEFKDVSFRIFAMSLPGFGYSTPLKRVVDTVDTAVLIDALMRYEKAKTYYVHGEDWGSNVATNLASLYPNRVRGIHLTFPTAFGAELSSVFDLSVYLIGQILPSTFYTPQEIELYFPQKYSFLNRLWILWSGMGYMHIQGTKPDTLSHALTDSPAGLMVYILEKYSSWTFDNDRDVYGKRDGGLSKLDKDHLLTIVTIYWMTNSISSSIRYYKAYFNSAFSASGGVKADIRSAKVPDHVRVGVQAMNNEIVLIPSRVVQMKYPNVTQFTIVKDAGHFAAFEKPQETAINFVKFVHNKSL